MQADLIEDRRVFIGRHTSRRAQTIVSGAKCQWMATDTMSPADRQHQGHHIELRLGLLPPPAEDEWLRSGPPKPEFRDVEFLAQHGQIALPLGNCGGEVARASLLC